LEAKDETANGQDSDDQLPAWADNDDEDRQYLNN
jgi:hypothetical protein